MAPARSPAKSGNGMFHLSLKERALAGRVAQMQLADKKAILAKGTGATVGTEATRWQHEQGAWEK